MYLANNKWGRMLCVFHLKMDLREWIKKTWSIYTMEYYSAIRKDEYLPFTSTWMESESIMLSERSQSHAHTNMQAHMHAYYVLGKKKKSIVAEKKPYLIINTKKCIKY